MRRSVIVVARRAPRFVGLIVGVALLSPAVASAQTIGIFRWQTQPFCNVLTLAVSVAGAAFRFEGTDDQCGAPTKASVIGMAFPNADGSIGLRNDDRVTRNGGGAPRRHDSAQRRFQWHLARHGGAYRHVAVHVRRGCRWSGAAVGHCFDSVRDGADTAERCERSRALRYRDY